MMKRSTNLKTITAIFLTALLFLSSGCSKGNSPTATSSPGAGETTSQDAGAAEALLEKANMARGEGKYEEADGLYDQAQVADFENKEVAYMRASNFALWGKPQRAVGSLQLAVDLGFADMERLESDVALDTIRDRDDYSLVVEAVRENQADQATDEGGEETPEPSASGTPAEVEATETPAASAEAAPTETPAAAE